MGGARERRGGGWKGATERNIGARDGRGRKGDREGVPWGGPWPVYSAHNNTHATLAIATLVLQIQNNCKRVYKLCIVMRRNVLFDRWMT